MQIVIDISDNVFKKLVAGKIQYGGITARNIFNLVKEGTLLPKGHGRLIDTNSIYQIVRPIEETDNSWGITGETAIRLIHEAFNRAPTILEADKSEGGE